VQLLQEAFSIDGSDDQQVGRIKDTFLTFGPRMANALVRFAPHQAAPNRWDFAAFVDPSRPTDLFIRPGYFGLQAVDRAATLIHEYIHMKYPNNSGDGHPGGQYISFTRASLNVPFDQAVRNPYCFQYYAQYVGTLGP
jgi:hypothetical protein